jgi:predicted O-methyltransferase YrrM
MTDTYRSPDWDRYRMVYADPYHELEPLAQEVAVVDEALTALRAAGLLPHTDYDAEKMLAHRAAVRETFDVPWTAITPRMERLLYAINSIARPANMVAAGVFCGFTFISNAGAAVGPGASYAARSLTGVEIKPEEAERAERNVRRIDPTGVARVLAAEAVEFVGSFGEEIDLLYLDADGAGGRGKSVYLDILEAAWDRMPAGSVVLAHNSVNCAQKLENYLGFVRDPARLSASVNVIFDAEGLEVSVK